LRAINANRTSRTEAVSIFDVDRIWDTVIAVGLACAGGLARILNAKDDTKLEWGRLLSELFLSGFIGVVVLMFTRAIGLSGDWVGLLCGMGGWMGTRMLDLIEEISGEKIRAKNKKED
jgi:hypothetical protein